MSRDCKFGTLVAVPQRKMETQMVNRCWLLLSAYRAKPGVRQCALACFHDPFTSPAHPSWLDPILLLFYVLPSGLRKFDFHVRSAYAWGAASHLGRGKWLSSKNTTKEIIDLYLLCAQRRHPGRRLIPEVPSRPSVLFTMALKPRTGTEICFCPLSDFIYSRSLAVKLEFMTYFLIRNNVL